MPKYLGNHFHGIIILKCITAKSFKLDEDPVLPPSSAHASECYESAMLPSCHDGDLQATIAGSASERAEVYDEWLSFISSHVFSYRLTKSIPKDRHFQISAQSRSAEGFEVGRFTTVAGKSRLIRDASDIGRDGRSPYGVFLSLHGELQLAQLRREHTSGPSSLLLLSAAQPLVHTKLGDNDTVTFLMPQAFVEQRLLHAEKACMCPIGITEGFGHLVRDTLATLQADARQMSSIQFERALRLVGDLVLLAFVGCSDITVDDRSVRAAVLARVKRVIRMRSSDPDLTLAAVASACNISLGYLHNLFRDNGQTAWEYLKEDRLQRARELLRSPPPHLATVTAISLACGFSNLSQFSTAFKRAFGICPGDVLRHNGHH